LAWEKGTKLILSELVKKIKEKIEYPVDNPRVIPAGIIDRFEKWHIKQVN